jgi:hypothetical protein
MVMELFMIVLFYPASGSSGEKTVIGWMIPASLLLSATLILNFLMQRYDRKMTEPLTLNPIFVENTEKMGTT